MSILKAWFERPSSLVGVLLKPPYCPWGAKEVLVVGSPLPTLEVPHHRESLYQGLPYVVMRNANHPPAICLGIHVLFAWKLFEASF